jgi:hypothetical protein
LIRRRDPTRRQTSDALPILKSSFIMPFRNYHQFDSATVRLMTEACDAALLQLGITGTDPMSGEIAAEIALLADAGERDPGVLSAKALERMQVRGRRIAGRGSQAST